jgi:VIT1/CCC1 family predicted Fe2+/Mn2+ transporter
MLVWGIRERVIDSFGSPCDTRRVDADRRTQLVSSIAIISGAVLIVVASIRWFVSGEMNPFPMIVGVVLALFGALYGLPSNVRAFRRALRGAPAP